MSLLDDYVGVASGASVVVNGQAPATHAAKVLGSSMFSVDKVALPDGLQFTDVRVQNNILVLAVANNKLIKIDLASPNDLIDLEIPRAKGDAGQLQRIFLDTTGNHLLVTTNNGENWYLHPRLSKAVKLSKLKGNVTSVAWNFKGTDYATKEILVGLSSGSVFEASLEAAEGFNRSVERFAKLVFTHSQQEPISGLLCYPDKSNKETHIIISNAKSILHFTGVANRSSGDTPIYSAILDGQAGEHGFSAEAEISHLDAVIDEDSRSGLHYAWTCSSGILHGEAPSLPGGGSFEDSRLIGLDTGAASLLMLSSYHVLLLSNSRVFAYNRFNDSEVFTEQVQSLDPLFGLAADHVKNTYWLFSATELFEITIEDEGQQLWDIFLKRKDYERALRYASNEIQIFTIRESQAKELMARQDYMAAAILFAQTSLPIESVALPLLDLNQRDALRAYLLNKLDTLKRGADVQRVLLSTWILELFLSKFNALEDARNVNGNLRIESGTQDYEALEEKYQAFINKHKLALDKQTTYALISSHGRPKQLLVFARAINDYAYIVDQYIQEDKYLEALQALRQQKDLSLTYATASTLLPEIPSETVEAWMEMPGLDASKLLPAILLYNTRRQVKIQDNQAVRYLRFAVRHQHNTDAAVHNALLGLYARDANGDETLLLDYLHSQSSTPLYDLDFALRQCKQYNCVLSTVHILSSMGLHDQAVNFALKHDNIELATAVADKMDQSPQVRKQLWLLIAKQVLTRGPDGIKQVLALSKRNNDILRIEDLVPHLTKDFVVLDDFTDDICNALERYGKQIAELRRSMDEASVTANRIQQATDALNDRFALLSIGDPCVVCNQPVMQRQFYVFPCQHAAHSDCLVRKLLATVTPAAKRRLAHLQGIVARTGIVTVPAASSAASVRSNSTTLQNGQSVTQAALEDAREELDTLIASECIHCGSLKIKTIDEPFIGDTDADREEAQSWQV